MGEAKELFLTIDAGTTAIKVSALNSAFKIVASENMEYQLITDVILSLENSVLLILILHVWMYAKYT